MLNRQLLIAICLLMAIVATPTLTNAQPTTRPNQIVVMISLDGLAGFYLDDAKAEMPVLRQLAAEGSRASSMKAVAPSVTWPNHTTLVTGDQPGTHGVVGNNFFNRETGKPVALIGDPVLDKDQIVKVPTIYDVAHNAGLKTAAFRWPACRNAKTLDWNLPDCGDRSVRNQYTTPELLQQLQEAGVIAAADSGDDSETADDIALDAFLLTLKTHQPNLSLLHLAKVDHTEHLNGPRSPEAYAAIKAVDAQVGQVRDALDRQFPGKATLIIVSDHGFSAIEHAILPNVILKQAGLIEVKGPRVVGGSVRLVAQGGAAMFYITDKPHRDDIAAKIKKLFDSTEGVETVLMPDQTGGYGFVDPKIDPHEPDMVMFAKEGFTFGDTAAGVLSFNEKPERKGTHGHNPDLPDLHATFIAWGAGIKPGVKLGEISNLDVAPTIAKMLDLQMPNTQGKPLDDLLAGKEQQ